MQEAARIGSRMTHERATAELLREISEWHHSGVAKAQLMRRARTLGHDLTRRRRIVLIHWEETDGSPPGIGSEQVVRQVEEVFNSADDLVAPLARMVVAVAAPDDASVADRCREFVASARHRGLHVRVAIGSAATGVAAIECLGTGCLRCAAVGTGSASGPGCP